MTKRQREILSTIVKAGGAGCFRVNDERSMKPFRALYRANADLHTLWTGCVVYAWIGEKCPFVSSPMFGYDFAEGPVEPRDVAMTRNHLLGLGRKGWNDLAVTGVHHRPHGWTHKTITVADLAAKAVS